MNLYKECLSVLKSQAKVERRLKKVPAVLTGLLWISLSLNFFLLPHNIASGGVGAIGFLVEMIFAVDRHLIVTIVNFTMLALAFIFLGKQTFAKTLLGSIVRKHAFPNISAASA